jgi:hypothetical protein
MKNLKLTFAVLVMSLLFTSLLAGQESGKTEFKKMSETGITNLINGVKSDNPGLKKSSIFMAGKYNVVEMEDVLIAELKNQNDPEIKLLIATALHGMYSKKGMIALEDFAQDSSNPRLQKFAKLYIADFNKNHMPVAQN